MRKYVHSSRIQGHFDHIINGRTRNEKASIIMLRSALGFEMGVRIALYLTLPDMYRVKIPKDLYLCHKK